MGQAQKKTMHVGVWLAGRCLAWAYGLLGLLARQPAAGPAHGSVTLEQLGQTRVFVCLLGLHALDLALFWTCKNGLAKVLDYWASRLGPVKDK